MKFRKPVYGMLVLMLLSALPVYSQLVMICFDESCEVKINGSSNVSPFSCGMIEIPVQKAPIPVNAVYREGKLYMNNVVVLLPTVHFACDNKAMTRDFLKALKADEFPNMQIFFTHLVLPTSLSLKSTQTDVPALVSFSIAGVKRKYSLVFDRVDLKSDILTIIGGITLKMSDFGITPPTAMFGMVKANDVIRINFVLRFCVSK